MAGDWLAACKDLPDKPEVLAIANATGMEPELVAARLVWRFWAWADGQTEDGFIPYCTVANLVDRCRLPELFWLSLQKAGWLVVSDEGIMLPNFRRWMGKSAKRRLAKNARQARWRAPGQESVDASVGAAAPHKAPTTEPNRTNNPPYPPKGEQEKAFEEFWQAYPRKEDYPPALQAWKELDPDPPMIAAILCAIQRQRTSARWLQKDGQYIPKPAKYLRGRYWENAGPSTAPGESPQERIAREQQEAKRLEAEAAAARPQVQAILHRRKKGARA